MTNINLINNYIDPNVFNNINPNTGFAILRMSVDKNQPELLNKYNAYVRQHNETVQNSQFPNSGFDLFFPKSQSFTGMKAEFASMGVKCDMRIYDSIMNQWKPTGFYMYPRSSMSKTPLMLANHTGIIDSGYRGELIGAFRHLSQTSPPYEVEQGTRLLQICAPDLRPILVYLVDETELEVTERGAGGFGSTGI